MQSSAADTNLVRGGKSSTQLRSQAADLRLQLLLVSVLACQLLSKVLLFGLGSSQLTGQVMDVPQQPRLDGLLLRQVVPQVLLPDLGISQAGFSAVCSAVGLVHLDLPSCNLLHP